MANYVKGQPFVPQFTDPATGDLMSGGSVEAYLWGTSTPTPFYSDSIGTSAGTSFTLDSAGKPTGIDLFFDDTISYKFLVKNAAGSTLDTIGPYSVPATGIALAAAHPKILTNIAAIQAATLSGVVEVQTLGYTSAGDGGAAFYRADTADTTTADDDFLVIVSNDGVRFKLQHKGIIDVKWAGAQTAASAATNATAIQLVLARTTANTEVCALSPAAYSVSSGLTASGNDIAIIGASMETVSIDATSAVTGAILDINNGGASRYSRGHISNFKITGARTGSNPDATWYDDTYHSSHGLRVNNVVNGLTIERIRVVRTTTAGIEFAGNNWFNTIKDCFVEKCEGSGFYLKSNSNGVHLDSCKSYLVEIGMTIEDSFAVNLSGCGIEDTRGNGLRISGESVVAIAGTWFEDHGLGTVTDGAIYVSGVVGDTARPSTLSVDGCFFNSAGDYVVKGENSKITVHGSRSDGSTINVFNLDANCKLDDRETNYWVYSGNLYEGAGFPTALVNYDGTWTPVISDAATAGNTATFDANATSQKYFKRGKLVTLQARLENINTAGMTAGNILFIQGLPIAASATDYSTGSCQLSEVTISGAYVVPLIAGSGSTTAMYLTDINTATTKTSIKVSDVTATTADIFISLTYTI